MILKCVGKKVIQTAKYSFDLIHIGLIIYNLGEIDGRLSLSKYDSFPKESDLGAHLSSLY